MHVLDDRHLDELQPPTGVRDLRPPPAPAVLHRGKVCWYWEVPRCPLCAKKHQHGGGSLDKDPRRHLSHRVGHCGGQRDPDGPDGYILVDADPERTAACIANYQGALRWDR